MREPQKQWSWTENLVLVEDGRCDCLKEATGLKCITHVNNKRKSV